MARKRRKKETQAQKAAKKVLERKGVDYKKWEKDILNQRKLAVMSDEDQEWTEKVLEEEFTKLVMNEVIGKENKTTTQENTLKQKH